MPIECEKYLKPTKNKAGNLQQLQVRVALNKKTK